jgi:hypothetical protein
MQSLYRRSKSQVSLQNLSDANFIRVTRLYRVSPAPGGKFAIWTPTPAAEAAYHQYVSPLIQARAHALYQQNPSEPPTLQSLGGFGNVTGKGADHPVRTTAAFFVSPQPLPTFQTPLPQK